ncbi:MAG TPA: hypothetical protein VF175_11955 [Lacipirellula sp.]
MARLSIADAVVRGFGFVQLMQTLLSSASAARGLPRYLSGSTGVRMKRRRQA